jgi:hypothetical protein
MRKTATISVTLGGDKAADDDLRSRVEAIAFSYLDVLPEAEGDGYWLSSDDGTFARLVATAEYTAGLSSIELYVAVAQIPGIKCRICGAYNSDWTEPRTLDQAIDWAVHHACGPWVSGAQVLDEALSGVRADGGMPQDGRAPR